MDDALLIDRLRTLVESAKDTINELVGFLANYNVDLPLCRSGDEIPERVRDIKGAL